MLWANKEKNQPKGKEMATEKQKLHNNLASLRGVDKFIDFLLLHVDKTMKIQGSLFVAEYIVKLCRDRKKYNQKYREETIDKIKEINEQRFDRDYIYSNHGEDDFNTWGNV